MESRNFASSNVPIPDVNVLQKHRLTGRETPYREVVSPPQHQYPPSSFSVAAATTLQPYNVAPQQEYQHLQQQQRQQSLFQPHPPPPAPTSSSMLSTSPSPSSSSSPSIPQQHPVPCQNPQPVVLHTQSSRSVTKKSTTGSFFTLACLNCRSKKIKCMLEEGGCRKCKKLGIHCPGPEVDERKRPSSKRHIRDLYQRISALEHALKESESLRKAEAQNFYTMQGLNQFSTPQSSVSLLRRNTPNNIIARLCDGRYQLNYDSGGRLRYFGPTSSLHLTETVTSNIVGTWGEQSTDSKLDVFKVDSETQDYLLSLYWKYQHTELQIFHKEAFLRDMATGRSKFFSKALLYCVMACAARISHRPEIRALVLDRDLANMEERPALFVAASKLVDEELKNPQVTTVQSLLLLSVIYCASSEDTKGWVLTGTACRLALDLGLHRDCSNLVVGKMSDMDLEARKIAFWGCVVFDRLWSLYLGRQYCLKLDEDVTITRPGISSSEAPPTWEAMLAGSWTRLLEIVGMICESLNQNKCNMARVNDLGGRLRGWYDGLDESLQYRSDGAPSVAVMHMQYCSAMVLLYRPLADFGVDPSEKTEHSPQFRLICLKHSKDIARYLEHYRARHRNATTLSGIALHVISTAATTLIADIAERRNSDVRHEFLCLAVCVRTLLELEQTYLVAQQVRKIIKVVIGLCNLDSPQIQSASILPDGIEIGASIDTSSSSSSSPFSPPASQASSNSRQQMSSEDSPDEDIEVDRDVNSDLVMQRLNSRPPEGPFEVEPLQMPESCYPGMAYNSFAFGDATGSVPSDMHGLYSIIQ